MRDLVRLNETEVSEKSNSDGFTFWVPIPLFPIPFRLDWLPRLTNINPISELTPNYLPANWCKTHWHFILLQEKEMGPLNWLSLSKHSTKHLSEFLFPSPQSKHCFCWERTATLFCIAAQYFMPLSATHPPIKANSSPPVPETHFR